MSDDLNPLVELALVVGGLIILSKLGPSKENVQKKLQAREAAEREAEQKVRRKQWEAQKKEAEEAEEQREEEYQIALETGVDVCHSCHTVEPSRCGYGTCCLSGLTCCCTCD